LYSPKPAVDPVVFKSIASIVPVPLKVPDGESIFTTFSNFLRHIDTVNHRAQLKRRVQLLRNIDLDLSCRFAGSGVHIAANNLGTPFPHISCRLCPSWDPKIGFGANITDVLSAIQIHVTSSGHSGGTKAGDKADTVHFPLRSPPPPS
jgi:hypothetical protein